MSAKLRRGAGRSSPIIGGIAVTGGSVSTLGFLPFGPRSDPGFGDPSRGFIPVTAIGLGKGRTCGMIGKRRKRGGIGESATLRANRAICGGPQLPPALQVTAPFGKFASG